MERIKNFFNDESGAAAVEYGLLVALIAVVIVASGYGIWVAISTPCSMLQPRCAYRSPAADLFGLRHRWGRLPCRASISQELENRTGNSKISGPVLSETGQASPHDRISQGLAQVGMAGTLEREKPFSPSWMILKS